MDGNHDYKYATSAAGAANADAAQEFNDAVRADALIHATLALAYEQRTANLIALYGTADLANALERSQWDRALSQITERLDLA